jgi:predicted oxidoreductase
MKNNGENCLIYGCMGLGGGWSRDPLTPDDERVAHDAVFTALDTGIKIFDLADIYAYGKAEKVFGNVLKSNPGLREKIVIQSKAGIMLGKGPENSSIYNSSADYLVQQVNVILERLNTDYLDVLLLHRPDVLMDAAEVAETFYRLREQGLVKKFGVSNMSVSQIMLIRNYWKDGLVANQIRFGLGHALALDMAISIDTTMIPYDSGLQGMLEYCQVNHMAIQAWAPLDRGLYTGKPHASLDEKDLMTAVLVSRFAGKYHVHESSIALAWLLMIPGTIQPIIGTTKPDRIRACKDALSVKLSREEWYELWITARGKRLP